MKTRALILLAAGGVAAAPLGAHAAPRLLTSADGAQTMEAKVADVYSTSGGLLVLLEMGDGRQIKTPADAFSESDREYFETLAALKTAGRYVTLNVEETADESSRALTRGRKITTSPTSFSLNIRNGSDAPVADLKLEYKIFYQKAVRLAKDRDTRETRIAEGTLEVAELASLEAKDLETHAVEIVSDRPNRGGPG